MVDVLAVLGWKSIEEYMIEPTGWVADKTVGGIGPSAASEKIMKACSLRTKPFLGINSPEVQGTTMETSEFASIPEFTERTTRWVSTDHEPSIGVLSKFCAKNPVKFELIPSSNGRNRVT